MAPLAVRLRQFGSIGDPPFTPRTGVANGRSFTAVSAVLYGGPGVAIGRHRIYLKRQNLEKRKGKESRMILSFGSLNLDLVTQTPRLPTPGETMLGTHFMTAPGGKGANQAVAAARLGISTRMVGRVGGDDFGPVLIQSLKAAGVKTDGVKIDEATHSGVAAIAVDASGENHIIVVPGANGRVDLSDVERLNQWLPNSQILMMQFEIPLSVVRQAAQSAHQAGVMVILDPAPAQTNLAADFYPLIEILTPNQVEAAQLVGFPVHDPQTAAEAAAVLRRRGVQTVIIKLGVQGALCSTTDQTFHIPAFPVTAVDTVAAGDAFNGGLATALAERLSLRQAVIRGNAVAALSVTKVGAQPSMPDREELDALLRK